MHPSFGPPNVGLSHDGGAAQKDACSDQPGGASPISGGFALSGLPPGGQIAIGIGACLDDYQVSRRHWPPNAAEEPWRAIRRLDSQGCTGDFCRQNTIFFKEREFSPQHAEYVRECVVAGLRLFPGEDAQWLLL
jgi:hypothetical protein